jgi:hypothetical protein
MARTTTVPARTCGRPQGMGLSVWLQPTDDPKAGKNRDHPDLVVDTRGCPVQQVSQSISARWARNRSAVCQSIGSGIG